MPFVESESGNATAPRSGKLVDLADCDSASDI